MTSKATATKPGMLSVYAPSGTPLVLCPSAAREVTRNNLSLSYYTCNTHSAFKTQALHKFTERRIQGFRKSD